jgi:hypothetical protein
MDLQLTKDEIPIFAEICFYAPIHPRLLEPNVSIEPTLANRVFPQAAEEWYDDLQKYLQTAQESDKEFYEGFVKGGKPQILKDIGYQQLSNPPWRDEVLTDSRGFARVLSISRNGGGTLHFNKGDINCRTYIPLDGKPGRHFNISAEKANELMYERSVDMGLVHVYAHHNVDYYPGALFLRNWAVLYLNEAMKSV